MVSWSEKFKYYIFVVKLFLWVWQSTKIFHNKIKLNKKFQTTVCMYAYKYVPPVTILKLITVTHFSGETGYYEPTPKRPVGETEGKYRYIDYY